MANFLPTAPAYGRYYHTKNQALDDWLEGKDFLAINKPIGWIGGPYFSIRDKDAIIDFGYQAIGVTTDEGIAIILL